MRCYTCDGRKPGDLISVDAKWRFSWIWPWIRRYFTCWECGREI